MYNNFISQTPLYFVYILFVILGFCGNIENSKISYYCSFFVSTLFFLSAGITVFYNNQWSAPKILHLVGSAFSEKYLQRDKSGVYKKPIILLTLGIATPFRFDKYHHRT